MNINNKKAKQIYRDYEPVSAGIYFSKFIYSFNKWADQVREYEHILNNNKIECTTNKQQNIETFRQISCRAN